MTLSGDIRHEIMLRDGFKCVYCGYDGAASFDAWRHGRLCIDHLKPRKSGGGNEKENLVTACAACNSDKAHHKFTSVEQGRRYLRLYWTEFSRPFYETYVVAKNPKLVGRGWGNFWERFKAGEDARER